MKKVLLSDYDRTLFTSIKDLKINVEAIKLFREKGGKFAIVTGRNYERIKQETIRHNIPYDYLSCVDGSVLYDEFDNIVKSYLLNEEMCTDFKRKVDEKTDIEMIIMKENNVKNINNIIQCYYDVTNYDKIEMLLDIIRNELENYNDLESTILNFTKEKLLIITPKNVNKRTSGMDIAKLENVTHDDIYCIGDHCNDIEMISYFNGYAMSDAEQEAKSVSLDLYDSVSDLIKDISLSKVKTKKRG